MDSGLTVCVTGLDPSVREEAYNEEGIPYGCMSHAGISSST
jgi:hypothetical protein